MRRRDTATSSLHPSVAGYRAADLLPLYEGGRIRLLLKLFTAFALLASVACKPSSPSADGGRGDAGDADAREIDTRQDRDTGEDDTGEVADTEGPSDAGTDVGAVDGGPTDPVWVVMPGLPEDCQMERALHPERLSEPNWISCGTGCEWLAPHPTLIRAGQSHSGWHDGERGFVWVAAQGLEPVAERRLQSWLMDDEGVVRAAWRSPPIGDGNVACIMKAAAAEGRAVGVLKYSKSSEPNGGRTYFYFGGIDDIKNIETYQLEIDETVLPRVVSLNSLTLSESLFAARVLPSGDLFLVRPDLTWERQTIEGEAGRPFVVGDEVLYTHFRFAGPSSFEVARFGEPAQELLVDAEAFLLALHVDWENRQMTWIRAQSPGAYREATRTDIYTASLTPVQPRSNQG